MFKEFNMYDVYPHTELLINVDMISSPTHQIPIEFQTKTPYMCPLESVGHFGLEQYVRIHQPEEKCLSQTRKYYRKLVVVCWGRYLGMGFIWGCWYIVSYRSSSSTRARTRT